MTSTRKPRVPPEFSRARVPEKVVSMNLLDGFVVQGSKGEKLIEEISGMQLECISRKGLSDIANVISILAQVKITRNIIRRKDLIVKWFEDNEERISECRSRLSFSIVKS